MKLMQLKYFKTVAELGRITQAAKVLYISPPALSATITSLEKELGVTLFSRSSNRIVLNEQGRIFLRYVNQIFNNLDCAKLELQKSLQENDNSIQIAVTTSNIWISLISAFAMEYPQIMLSCTTLKIPHLLNSNLSLLYSFVLAERSDFFPSEMDSVCLYEESPIALLPTNHPLAGKEEILLTDLTDEILFLPPAEQSLNKRIKKLFFDNHLSLKHAHECSDTTCKSMAAEGRGIAFATSRSIRSRAYPLSYVPIKAQDCCWEQRLYWDPNRKFTPEELTFKEFVLDMYHVPAQQD